MCDCQPAQTHTTRRTRSLLIGQENVGTLVGMRFAERVAGAMESDDLTMRLDRSCDADVLVALGWAAQREPLGSALLRLMLTHDVNRLEEAVDLAEQIAAGIRARWKMPKGARFWRRFAEQGVGYWCSSICRRCTGRMYDVLPNTPKLSTTRCSACHGTGRRRYPKIGSESMEDQFWRDRFAELLNALDEHADRTLRCARHMLTSKVQLAA
jgi:hypothetical protein